MRLTDIYRTFHLNTHQYTFFPATHGTVLQNQPHIKSLCKCKVKQNWKSILYSIWQQSNKTKYQHRKWLSKPDLNGTDTETNSWWMKPQETRILYSEGHRHSREETDYISGKRLASRIYKGTKHQKINQPIEKRGMKLNSELSNMKHRWLWKL